MISADVRLTLVYEPLSEAQRQILIHRTLGRDLAAICRLMHYAPDTVKHYLQEARERLQASNNEQACYLARYYGQICDHDILCEWTRMQEEERAGEEAAAIET